MYAQILKMELYFNTKEQDLAWTFENEWFSTQTQFSHI